MSARRIIYRLPLTLEGTGLPELAQRLLGVDWIVVETTGRRTGCRHVVALDVLHHDAGADRYYVQPAFPETDWVRNVRHEPRVTARVRGRRIDARVRDATGTEGAEAMLRFVRAHPWYARLVARLVGHVHGLGRPDDVLRREFESLTTFAIDVV